MTTIRTAGLVFGMMVATTGGNPSTVKADEFGCTVLLCLSNPAGAMAEPACVAPVTKLWDIIRSGGSPSCDGGAGVNLRISRGSKSKNRWVEFTDSTGNTSRTYY